MVEFTAGETEEINTERSKDLARKGTEELGGIVSGLKGSDCKGASCGKDLDK